MSVRCFTGETNVIPSVVNMISYCTLSFMDVTSVYSFRCRNYQCLYLFVLQALQVFIPSVAEMISVVPCFIGVTNVYCFCFSKTFSVSVPSIAEMISVVPCFIGVTNVYCFCFFFFKRSVFLFYGHHKFLFLLL